MTRQPLRRIGILCLALSLLLGAGPALADRDGKGPRSRHQGERSEAPREAPRLAPGSLRHREYDQPGRGDRRQSHPDYRREAAPPPGRPVNDVIRQVERNYGGKVVGVQQEGANYRVRVLQRDGRVKTVMMPAR